MSPNEGTNRKQDRLVELSQLSIIKDLQRQNETLRQQLSDCRREKIDGVDYQDTEPVEVEEAG